MLASSIRYVVKGSFSSSSNGILSNAIRSKISGVQTSVTYDQVGSLVPALPFAIQHIRFYSASRVPEESDRNQMWNEFDGMNHAYDPRFDSDFGEEDMGEGEDGGMPLSDEEYMKLLEYFQKVKVTEPNNIPNSRPAGVRAAVSQPIAAMKQKAISLEGDGATSRLRIGTLSLPNILTERVSEILHGYPRAWLRRDGEMLSLSLRARNSEHVTGKANRRIARSQETAKTEQELMKVEKEMPLLEYNQHQSMAFLAQRTHGNFASNSKVFSEILQRFPDFMPRKMLDFGSGVGSAVWAASQSWPTIRKFTLIEPSDSMHDISCKLLDGFPVERRSFLHQGKLETHDLVVASYSLTELSNDSARRIHLLSLWEHLEEGGLLVIIEPGTPVGFKIVRQVRATLLAFGNEIPGMARPEIIAPCPHAYQCPLTQTTWCHFTQRVQRSATARAAKGATESWENEKFSFIAISKGKLRGEKFLPASHPNYGKQWSRLIRQPLKRGGHVIIDACTPSGTAERVIVSKKNGKELYNDARKATWGDLFYLDRLNDQTETIANNPRRRWKHLSIQKKLKKSKAQQDLTGSFADVEIDSIMRDVTNPPSGDNKEKL